MPVALLRREISTGAAQVAPFYIITSLPAPGCPQELGVIFPETGFCGEQHSKLGLISFFLPLQGFAHPFSLWRFQPSVCCRNWWIKEMLYGEPRGERQVQERLAIAYPSSYSQSREILRRWSSQHTASSKRG